MPNINLECAAQGLSAMHGGNMSICHDWPTAAARGRKRQVKDRKHANRCGKSAHAERSGKSVEEKMRAPSEAASVPSKRAAAENMFHILK